MRVLVVEDEPYMAEAIRDGLRLEAIAADIAGDGDTALELLSINAYDIAVLDRDIPGPSGDEIAESIVASGSGMPILMLTAADRLDDKASGFELGADDYLTKPFELRELVLRLRALDRRRAHNRPPVRAITGLRLDAFRREVYRDGRYVALTRKQFAVLEVLVAAEGGVVSAEWCQSFIDYHYAATVRILDLPHACEYITLIGQSATADGRLLSAAECARLRHNLKHDGPAGVVAALRALVEGHGELPERAKALAYLEKRQEQLQYPRFMAEGWPLGSGMVERANKLVVEERL